jgi:hypothetical protein
MRETKRRGAGVAALLATTVLCALPFAGVCATTPRPAFASKGRFVHRTIRPSGAVTLYDQTAHDSGVSVVSQNFESSFDAYDCQSADDFIVPDGVKWRVTEIDIIGTTFNGSGVADSENLVTYKDKHGKPGRIVAEYDGLVGAETWGSFVVPLTTPAKLKPGHYWLSFQANESFSLQGEWGWEASNDTVGLPSEWRNPGGGFDTGCTDWTRQTDCYDAGQGDQMFALKGHAR